MIKELKRFYNKVYACELGRYVISCIVVFICFFVLYIKSPIVFFINDDENILYSLAGYYTYGFKADHSFINGILSVLLQGLYNIIPSIPWYGVFHVVVLFFSTVLLGKSILKIAYGKQYSLIYGLSIFSCTVIIVFLSTFILMQFTTTSAVAGTAGIVLLLCINERNQTKISMYADYLLSIIMILICYMHRKNTGYIILCFLLLVCLYKILYYLRGEKADILKKVIIYNVGYIVSVFVLIVSVTFISQNFIRSNDIWESFYEYDEARYKMTDYPHDSIYDNPELYKEIEWDEELYNIAGTYLWFFMDERINVETFDKISQTGFYDYDNFDLKIITERGVNLLQTEKIACCLFVFFIIFFLGSVYSFVRKKKWLETLMVLCTTGGAFLMCFYLCWKGRFILRAFQVIIFPAIMIVVIMFLNKSMNDIKKTIISRQNILFMILMLIVVHIGYNNFQDIRNMAYERQQKSQRTLLVEEYALNHSDKMYIYDTSLTFRYMPFTVYEDDYPSNLMFWGGMGWKSPTYYKQLELNGINGDLYSTIFFEDNVYYISYDGFNIYGDSKVKEVFADYMNSTYGDIILEEVDRISEEIIVYKISKI